MTPSPDQSDGAGAGHSLFGVDPADEATCSVCNEPVEASTSALCSQCGEPYHLVLTNAGEGKNCGEVWLSEEFLALQFGCEGCLTEAQTKTPARAEPEQTGRPVRHTGRRARDIVRSRRR